MTTQIESYSLTKLLSETQEYIISFFVNHDYNKYAYHNLQHTKNVIEAAETMARHYQLNEKDFFILIASAWFHDISCDEGPQEHEHRSAMLAQDYFQSKSLENDTIGTIKRTILATRFPRSPQNLIEQIICETETCSTWEWGILKNKISYCAWKLPTWTKRRSAKINGESQR